MDMEGEDGLDPRRDHGSTTEATPADGGVPGAGPRQRADSRPVRSSGLPELAPDIRARLETMEARAAAKVARVQDSPLAPLLLSAARSARSVRTRVVWPQRWGSAWAQPLANVAACQRGCSHCCYLPVAITSAEAKLIGEAAGRRPAGLKGAPALKDLAADPDFAQRHRDAERRVRGTACPFLHKGECTVYEHRPFACRTHLSLDDDDLLCRLVDGIDVPVPYANAAVVYGVFLAAQPNEQLADIREFFPTRRAVPDQEEAER